MRTVVAIICLASALLLPTADLAEPRLAARWPQRWERLPLPDPIGDCPAPFEAWRWNKKDAICVRRA